MMSLPLWALLLLAVPALLNIWAIWHAYTHSFQRAEERLVWMVVAVFIPVIGGLAYLLFGLRRAKKHPDII